MGTLCSEVDCVVRGKTTSKLRATKTKTKRENEETNFLAGFFAVITRPKSSSLIEMEMRFNL